jgi:hypothetical protein
MPTRKSENTTRHKIFSWYLGEDLNFGTVLKCFKSIALMLAIVDLVKIKEAGQHMADRP